MLSTDDLWIQPRPRAFGPDAARLLFRVESGMLKAGRDYRPNITITTDGGIFKPVLLIRKSWPWVV
ncbi:MAG TPA: hypothetical protein DCS42_04565, partial [Nitrospiraceae bacterium]|nr:hypothetical protein [Nitrospiraceae bacterium]